MSDAETLGALVHDYVRAQCDVLRIPARRSPRATKASFTPRGWRSGACAPRCAPSAPSTTPMTARRSRTSCGGRATCSARCATCRCSLRVSRKRTPPLRPPPGPCSPREIDRDRVHAWRAVTDGLGRPARGGPVRHGLALARSSAVQQPCRAPCPPRREARRQGGLAVEEATRSGREPRRMPRPKRPARCCTTPAKRRSVIVTRSNSRFPFWTPARRRRSSGDGRCRTRSAPIRTPSSLWLFWSASTSTRRVAKPRWLCRI